MSKKKNKKNKKIKLTKKKLKGGADFENPFAEAPPLYYQAQAIQASQEIKDDDITKPIVLYISGHGQVIHPEINIERTKYLINLYANGRYKYVSPTNFGEVLDYDDVPQGDQHIIDTAKVIGPDDIINRIEGFPDFDGRLNWSEKKTIMDYAFTFDNNHSMSEHWGVFKIFTNDDDPEQGDYTNTLTNYVYNINSYLNENDKNRYLNYKGEQAPLVLFMSDIVRFFNEICGRQVLVFLMTCRVLQPDLDINSYIGSYRNIIDICKTETTHPTIYEPEGTISNIDEDIDTGFYNVPIIQGLQNHGLKNLEILNDEQIRERIRQINKYVNENPIGLMNQKGVNMNIVEESFFSDLPGLEIPEGMFDNVSLESIETLFSQDPEYLQSGQSYF